MAKIFLEWLNAVEGSDIIVCEGSLSRMLSLSGDGSGGISNPFAIITAYRKFNDDGTPRTKAENIINNRGLRGVLNGLKLGVHQLIGHWQECKDSSIPYKDCPTDMKTDVIERSYFVPKDEKLSQVDFEKLIANIGKQYSQDAVVLSDGNVVRVVYTNGGEDIIGSKLGLNQIAQGYSQHILKQNVPFRFEGFEQFHGNAARQGASVSGLQLPPMNESFKTIKAQLIN